MRLVEFLIQILETHAETLKRLAAFFGEEALIEILEQAGELTETKEPKREDLAQTVHLDRPLAGSSTGLAYQELEGAVREFGLPEFLAFHLWAYPHYRAFIESPLDLNSRIPGPGGETGSQLVEEAVSKAQEWIQELPIPPAVSAQAERAALVPWLRFRTNVLRRIGKRPLGPVY